MTDRHVRRLSRCTSVLALTAALVASVIGCSSGSDETASDHNAVDTAFATEMIGHHDQALEMVEMTAGRPLDPQVSDLAERIRTAQAPEIEQMSG
jgi:uncharacterized protein (DUF305 family)